MVKYLHTIFLVLLLFSLGSFSTIEGQQQNYTPKKGLEYIKAEDYKNAELVYTYLLKKYPKDGAYNFYMGICLLYNKGDISQSIKMLNYARIKKVSRKVHFYLGRAHQLAFNFEEAVSNLEIYLKNASSSDNKIEIAKLYLEQSRNSRKISSKIYELTVIDKSKTLKGDILEMYYPADDVGKLHRNGDFFESGVNPNNVMFETERGDVVYFSMATSNEDTLSIYKMEKLLDGWGDSQSIGEPVNSVYNDAYPFMATDGLTLYFSSDRPGGFGGFDIYKIYYDNELQEFLEPINIGVPFNSPGDDFLFVSDEFNEVAWFASNRETTGDTVMVYTVKWDGNQIRNMVEDANQISESAKLRIQGTGHSVDDGRADFTYKKNRKNKKTSGLFNFEINDTIAYSTFDHFINEEALELFRAGYSLQLKKDSLSSLMKSRRIDYSKISNEVEKNKVVNEILNLENKVYSLEDQIEEKYLYARQKELHEIQNRLREGDYNSSRQVKMDKPKVLSIEGVFIPEKYAFHTSDEFARQYAKQEDMYNQMFSKNDIISLRYADSLYVWANILNLESARLLERSTQVEEEESIKLGQLLKRSDSLQNEAEETTSSNMMRESKELKLLSNRIYHKALDKKYPIYYLKLKDVSRKLNESNSQGVLLLSQQGNAFYRESKEVLTGAAGLNIESYEKAGTLKKAAVEKQEKALRLYGNLDKGTLQNEISDTKDEPKGVVQKSYAELHKGEDALVHNQIEKEVEVVDEVKKESAVDIEETKLQSVFKIQIGVFRNSPKKEALDKIPPVSTQEIEGRGLTKYFSGSYNSYQEAQSMISSIVEAGFTGAFVVFFKDGKLSSIPQK